MINHLFRLFLFSFILFSSATAIAAKIAKDQKAPDIRLNYIDKSAMLSDYTGQVVYLDFWASWCKPCRRSFPWMNIVQRKYEKQGLKVIAINLDSDPELASKFLKEVPAKFNIAYDHNGETAETYKLQSMPSSYLIDRKGILRFGHLGFFINKQSKYEQEIETLLAEKE